MNISKILLFCCSILTASLSAQDIHWKTADPTALQRFERTDKDIIPQKAFTFELNIARFSLQLENIPQRFSTSDEALLPTIALPMPDASIKRFKVVEAPFFHEALQRKYPTIRSFAGYEVGNKQVSIRFDISLGKLSAMILDGDKAIFIDPYCENSSVFYNSYEKKDYVADKRFSCHLTTHDFSIWKEQNENLRSAQTGDGFLRKYRLALACTGEYAKYHGGTIPKVLAAMNKSMTRVNGVYEKEFALTMELIPNDTLLIFLNSATDGYSNNDGPKMLGENQAKCDNIIGASNYDIGHVFSTGGGGIASLQSPCRNGSKARGVTGLGAPKGDPFDIDYVCHEMGHQYGGEHTYNNSCEGNISTSSSYEPGSGSTIMAYAGICPPNVQSNSHAYFHAISIAQINTYTVNSLGNSCPQKISTSNLQAPIVNAGADYTIPKETPFELMGVGSDAETATANLTYCWEQYDREVVPQAPTGNATNGPLFRSLQPTNTPLRIFPPMNNIVRNTRNTWEVLPRVARNINFRLTVRDNDVNGGRSSVDAMRITVADAAPFRVTHPDTSKIVFIGGQYYDIKWDASSTNAAPINTSQVMILLSTDGGFTYPDTLASAVANNGLASVKFPEINTKTARVKIKGVNNVFFDISNNNFDIQKPLIPSFLFTSANTTTSICKASTDTVRFLINVESVANFKKTVKLSATNLPSGLKVAFSQDTITPAGKIEVIFFNLKNTISGKHTIAIVGQSGTLNDSENFTLNLFAPLNGKINPIQPLTYERGFGANGLFSWNSIKEAQQYLIEISQTPDFKTIIESKTIEDTTYTAQQLAQSKIYYWRIKAQNACNESDAIEPIVFQTSELFCDTISNSTALAIPTSVGEVASNIEISRKGLLADLDVYARIDHAYLSDLAVTLVSPNGDDITLFAGICTDRDNAEVTLDDAGGNLTCTAVGTTTLRGRYRPQEPLASFNYKTIKGIWTLKIKDNRETVGGTLRTWNMRTCTNSIPDEKFAVTTQPITVKEGNNAIIEDTYLAANSGIAAITPSQITFKILQLPKYGTLKNGNITLAVGAAMTQQDIDAGNVSYFANANAGAEKDTFLFETINTAGGWIPNTAFSINIQKNNLKFKVTVDSIKCFGDTNGSITINVVSGKAPIEYRINNGAYSSNNVFDNLTAGDYSLEAKDADGFTSLTSITLSSPSQLVAQVEVDKNNVSLLASGGTSPYQYNYNNQGFSTNNTFPNQNNGWYYFIVSDANGCLLSDSFKVAYTTLSIGSLSTLPRCAGESNGTITILASGGKAPFDYQLNGSGFQNSNIYDALSAGKYTIAVKDAEGFIKTDTITLSQPTPLTFTIAPRQDSLSFVPQGGTPPYQFSIDNGKTVQTSPIFIKIANGTYPLWIKDANGCIVTTSYQFISNVETLDALGIQIFPNPAGNFMIIDFTKSAMQDVELQIFNVMGQLVYTNYFSGTLAQQSIEVANFSEGVYQVVLKDRSFYGASKVIIKR
jgi:subtilisin-like proprotein convertase family protein